MNAAKILGLALTLIASVCVRGWGNGDRHPAQITFRVFTDEGQPVSNVEVTTSTFLRWQPGEGFGQDVYEETKTLTDADGFATVSFMSERGDCNYGIYDASGYYATRNLVYRFQELTAGHWGPWNPTIDIVCKPITKPIPMYVRTVGGIGYPKIVPFVDEPVGFDLMIGDWVSPNGKGEIADLVFTLSERLPKGQGNKAFEYSLNVTFSNEGDGIQEVFAPPFKGSELRLPRYAPETGYKAELLKQIGRSGTGQPIYPASREDQNYFFRVRTVRDGDGNIKSALYGKIAGDVRFGINRSVQFTYYLNPESMDRNMEFDRRRNLFDRLSSLESVSEP